MPTDRKLAVSCKFVGAYNDNGPQGPGLYGEMTYLQLLEGTDPQTPNIVQTHGEIDVYSVTPDPRYNRSIDIYLSLDPTSYCTLQDGTLATVSWPPMIMNVYPSHSACVVLDAPPPNGTPVPASEASVSWADGRIGQVIFINDHDETKDYYYMPAVFVNLPNADPYFISCDPGIRNRGS